MCNNKANGQVVNSGRQQTQNFRHDGRRALVVPPRRGRVMGQRGVEYRALPAILDELMAPRTLAWLVLFALVAALGLRLHSALHPAEVDTLYREQAVYQQLRGIIHERYVTDITDTEEKKLFYGAMDGMASALDPHSRFFPPKEYGDFKVDTTGELEGVGIEIDANNPRGLAVLTPLQDTPAWKGGVLPGDLILKIDGVSTKEMKLEEASHRVKGKVGTQVVLTLLHEGQTVPVDITLTRAVIEIRSVPVAEILGKEWVSAGGPKIGYVEVLKFQQKTAADLDAALKKLEQQGLQALVLDLRQNHGGLLESAQDVADLFLKDGKIVSVITRVRDTGRTEERIYYAHEEGTRPDCPLAVLIDSQSASASEIVAGALQDRERAVLVGDRSFGKFSVQEVIPVSLSKWGEAALKLTIAKYKTPKGPCLDGQGITPDYLVPSSPEQQRALLLDRQQRKLKDNNPRGDQSAGAVPPAVGPDGKPQEPFVDAQLKKAVEVLLPKLQSAGN